MIILVHFLKRIINYSRIRQQGRREDSQKRTHKIEQTERDSQDGKAGQNRQEQDCQVRTARTRLPRQGCQHSRTEMRGQPDKDS
jgi:hypothetical protein